MENKKEKILKDVGYEEKKLEDPKSEEIPKSKVARNNRSLEKNSQFGEF